ncbi:unnamed protein product [Rotaria sordida]|uniref:Transmembrane protein 267 n=1 Tax=Rotaria sordida TaxID=392033 RepID=A0A814VGZ1_9BILA|nr:unnamed protein product [Rotaria sordida]CAF1456879.1 unnamed protein product [Rotaria sordida]
MFPSKPILLINGLNLFGLCFVSLVGDCLCFGRPLSIYIVSNMYLRALIDNFTHGLISVFATGFLFGWTRHSLLIIAFIAGCFIDIDHFIEIRSLSLNRILNNQRQNRPFLHNSLLLLIITFIVYSFEYFLWRNQNGYYSIIFFLGWSTHHLRDAQRRGLTLLPFGETSPIDYYLPIMCFVLIIMKLVHILKSLTLDNLYLIQGLPDNIYFIERLRSIWFENCTNVHFLLSPIAKQSLKNVILRRSTCDHAILTSFFDQLNTLRYLDLTSLQIIKSSNHINEQFHLPSKLKICSLNSTILKFCSFLPHTSLRALELIDINVDLLSIILNTFQSLKIVCLFFTTKNPSLSSTINYFQQHKYFQLLIHFHLLSIDDDDDDNNHDEKQSLPSNILIIPIKNSLSCFRYQNLIE